MLPVFGDACHWLDIYFSGRDPGFTPLLRPRATPFQKRVWVILLTIPFGQTVTYREIARRMASLPETTNVTRGGTTIIGSSVSPWPIERNISLTSARAVGGAVGRNPISLIIPCHRVIGADGSLTGYAAGIDKKIRLMKLEQSR